MDFGKRQLGFGVSIHTANLAGHGYGLGEASSSQGPLALLQTPIPAQAVELAQDEAEVLYPSEGGRASEVFLLQASLQELAPREAKRLNGRIIHNQRRLPPHVIHKAPRCLRFWPQALMTLTVK